MDYGREVMKTRASNSKLSKTITDKFWTDTWFAAVYYYYALIKHWSLDYQTLIDGT